VGVWERPLIKNVETGTGEPPSSEGLNESGFFDNGTPRRVN
jgi:hypothetical protein